MRSISALCLVTFMAAVVPTAAFAEGPRRFDTSLITESTVLRDTTTTTTGGGGGGAADSAAAGMSAGLIVGITVGALAVVGVVLWLSLRDWHSGNNAAAHAKPALNGPALMRW